MAGHVIEDMIGAFRSYGGKLIDRVYSYSLFSTISFGVAILILVIIGWAISNNLIHVPVFHPDIPVTSGS